MGNKQTRGTDLHLELTISAEEASQGCQKEIVVQRYERCQACSGKSQDVITHCGQCHGEGRVQNSRRIVLKIPAGIKDGTSIRLTGAGNVGISGSPSGDIYVVLIVTPAKQTRVPPHVSQTQPDDSSPSIKNGPSSTSSTSSSPIQSAAQILSQPRMIDVRDNASVVWKVGDLIHGEYEVTDIVGEGGMGIVYKIYHRPWNMVMAVKSPRPEIFASSGGKENFVREAETWVNLGKYAHLVNCYFVQSLGGIPRIFIEYIEGGSLADWIRQGRLYVGGPDQALERMLDVAIQFAWGMHFAHEQGLVHQDVKPANVMMTREGIAKVTDFGLAKAREMAGERRVQDGKGEQSVLVSSGWMTLAYCSPEQAAGQALSRKTDIWSWGLSVLEMFTGEVTWVTGVAAQKILAGYKQKDPAIPVMPVELWNLLKQCFQPAPEARPATMLKIAVELQEIYACYLKHPYAYTIPEATEMAENLRLNQGLSLLQLGRVEEALDFYERAIRLDPNSADAYYNMGIVLQNLGRLKDALDAYKQAIRLNPSDKDYYLNLGIILSMLRPGKEALVAFEQAIRLDPNFASAYCNRGLVLEQLGRSGEALAAYEQAIHLDSNLANFAFVQYNKGVALMKLERFEEALVAFEQAIRLDTNFAPAHHNKEIALAKLGGKGRGVGHS